MDKAIDIENLRPLLKKVLQTFQLSPEDIKDSGTNIHVSDHGTFRCTNEECFFRIGYSHEWRSAFSWLTFDLRELIVKKKWMMKCKFCRATCKPYFHSEQIESMFTKAVKIYKGENSNSEVNIGYGARRNFRQPHFPKLCEKCGWGATSCWIRH